MSRIIKNSITVGIVALLVGAGCKQNPDHSEQEGRSGSPVTVSAIRKGQMHSYIELSATSAFLYKAAVKSPVTGYINNMLINEGDAVKKNQTLFAIQTKEAAVLAKDTLKNMEFKGIVNVKSAMSGLISSIQHPQGDYVSEGDLLCQVAIPESFVFILDVPFELSRFVKVNRPCEVILPDSTSVNGIINAQLPSMDANSQTERFIVKLTEHRNLPENLTGKIRIVKEALKNVTSLPKSCILSDETMQHFWTMKLVNDSLAVKVPVTTGISEGEYVQIIRPSFRDSDLFLASGNFGLGDSAYVRVNKNIGDER